MKRSVSETYRDVEQTELNVRGTMSQLANDAISAQIRQNVSTALTSLSRYVWAVDKNISILHLSCRTSDLQCKHMHLSFKRVCNREHKGVICNRAYFHHFGTMTHTPGIGNFSA